MDFTGDVKLLINETVKPIQAATRHIPFHRRDAVWRLLEAKVRAGIIEKVNDEPTRWLNEVVYVPKIDSEGNKIPDDTPEGLRLCVDMKAANSAILRAKC